MSSPQKSPSRRNKSPLASDKALGKRNITPTKPKLHLTTNPTPRQKGSPDKIAGMNRSIPTTSNNILNATSKSHKPVHEPSPLRPMRLIDHSDSEALIDKLIRNREQICSCLELYDLLYANGAPLRCLVHNNFASLYCENEQKQLCVNCVYGNIQHKLHRVTPVKNVMQQIQLDLDIMSRKVGKVVESISDLEKVVSQNMLDVDQEMTLGLKLLEAEFERVHRALLEKYAQIRETILDNFSQAKIKHDILLQEIQVLKEIYNDHSVKLPASDDQPSKLYKHMVLSVLINDSDKFDNRMLKKFNGEEVRTACLRDLVRIRELCESSLLNNAASSSLGQPFQTSSSKHPLHQQNKSRNSSLSKFH